MNGQTSHLVGLRDCTDQNPLAAPGVAGVAGVAAPRGFAAPKEDGASGRPDAGSSINSHWVHCFGSLLLVFEQVRGALPVDKSGSLIR